MIAIRQSWPVARRSGDSSVIAPGALDPVSGMTISTWYYRPERPREPFDGRTALSQRSILDFWPCNPDTPPVARADAGTSHTGFAFDQRAQMLRHDRTHAIDWTGFDRSNLRLPAPDRHGSDCRNDNRFRTGNVRAGQCRPGRPAARGCGRAGSARRYGGSGAAAGCRGDWR